MISPRTSTIIVWSTIVALTLIGGLIHPLAAALGFAAGVYMAFAVWPRLWKYFP